MQLSGSKCKVATSKFSTFDLTYELGYDKYKGKKRRKLIDNKKLTAVSYLLTSAL